MDIDENQKRTDAYRTANESVKNLYGSMELGDILGSASERLKLNENKHDTFINLIGDMLLDIIPRSGIEDRLISELNIDTDSAHETFVEIKNFIAKFDARFQIPDAESLLKEKLELRPEGVERVAQPLTREDLLNALSAKRTMASDVARLQSEPAPSAPVTVGYQNYSAPPQPPQR